jgi:hypothetical protein
MASILKVLSGVLHGDRGALLSGSETVRSCGRPQPRTAFVVGDFGALAGKHCGLNVTMVRSKRRVLDEDLG